MNPSANDAFRRARSLVLRYGWNSICYQILNPGIALWFSKKHDALIGYAETGKHMIAAGSPVTAEEYLDDVVMEFSEFASRVKKKICFFGAQERIAGILSRHSPTSSVLLGAQPAWSPERWLNNVHKKPSLRAQLLRAKNKGVTTQILDVQMADKKAFVMPDPHQVRDKPRQASMFVDSRFPPEDHTRRADCGNDIDETVQKLRNVLSEWIATRRLPPMHFLVEPNTLGNLEDRIVVTASINEKIIGFCIASPIPLRKGWLVEQIVRGTHASNGTVELMLDALMLHLQALGSHFVTLGLSPLSRHYSMTIEHPLWLKTALRFTRLYGKYFYNFDGLDAFKAKFIPTEWEPVYAITNERKPTPSTLYAIASAFSGMSPIKFVVKGMLKIAIGR